MISNIESGSNKIASALMSATAGIGDTYVSVYVNGLMSAPVADINAYVSKRWG
jgi:mannose/fructose/N-acetylgalactosamine-specific phosphotransferase system component IID